MAQTTRKKKNAPRGDSKRKQRRSAPKAASVVKAPYKEGDIVRIVTAGSSHRGEVVGILEVGGDDVRTEFGWFDIDEIEPAPQTRRTTVDGKDADVVLDGKTGGVKAPENGAAPQQAKLLELSTEQLIHEMALKTIERNGLASQAGRLRNAVKEADKIIDGFVAELIERDAKEHNLQLQLSTTGDEPEDEDEEDDDDDEIEQRRAVNVGARTYESGEGPE